MGDPRESKSDLGWADMLSDMRKPGAREAPEGWKTAQEIADELGRSRPHTVKQLRIAIDEGRAERRTYQEWKGDRSYPTPYYRMIK
mgnify:CR=1 FL=1